MKYEQGMKGINLKTWEVKAINDGIKTEFSRPIKPQPHGIRQSVFTKSGIEDLHGYDINPQYQVGDILYVRDIRHCSTGRRNTGRHKL